MGAKIRISKFLRTGRFGPVKIEDSKAEVIRKLGKPDGEIQVKKPFIGIYYGRYEFFFDGSGLRSIQNDHFNPGFPDSMEFSNREIHIDPEFLRADKMKKLNEIESELIKHKIPYKYLEYWGRMVLKMESGVVIDFNDEKWDENEDSTTKINNPQEYELIGIRYYPKD